MRDFHLPGRSPVLATNGMCATSHPLAAKTAVETLERGGNAMDAALAGAVLLGICEPHMTGIGGDCFVLWSDSPGAPVQALNGSGRAASASDAGLLRAAGVTKVPGNSPHAVTLPGAVDAFCLLSDKVGKLGLDAVLAPAIHYAEQGVPVAARVASDWTTDAGNLQGIASEHFLINGRIPVGGELFRAPGQAEVLRRIARNGRDAFYTGEVMDDMLRALRTAGGVHSADDFAQVAATRADPVGGFYNDMEVIEHPPNGHGIIAHLILNILKHFDISAMAPFGTMRAHIEAEATKLAFDARNRFLGDPDHMSRTEYLLSPELAKNLAGLIDRSRAMPGPAALTEMVHKDTVYICVTDRNRMSVSLIYSLFSGFGSGICSEKFGILLQNRGAGFTLEEGHVNELKGCKRPLHTIIPGMIRENGRVTMPFGVMGGAYQPNGHARFISNMTDFGMDAQTAIDGPRTFAYEGEMRVENGYTDTVRQELSELGHKVVAPPTAIGGAQAVRLRNDGVLEGASDPRKDGCALGY